MTTQEQTAANVRAELARKGKKTKDFSDLLEISSEAARKKLNGTTKISVEELALLGQYLDVPIAYFLKDVDLSPICDAT